MSVRSEQLRRIIERLETLNSPQLEEVEALLEKLNPETANEQPPSVQGGAVDYWPHDPLHKLQGKGTWIVTAGTLHKQHYFRSRADLDFLQSELLNRAREYHWHLEAWAIFSNHYHFVGHALEDASSLRGFLKHLHAITAREVNERLNQKGIQVWHNYWETQLTFEKSYLARLNYVHQNAVHHGLVPVANQYPWCSAGWLERTATVAQVRTLYSFKTDRIKIHDDYEVLDVQ